MRPRVVALPAAAVVKDLSRRGCQRSRLEPEAISEIAVVPVDFLVTSIGRLRRGRSAGCRGSGVIQSKRLVEGGALRGGMLLVTRILARLRPSREDAAAVPLAQKAGGGLAQSRP